MILTCPSCTTRFLLPAYTLAPAGRRVKCSHCGALWHQQPDLEELEQDTGDDLEDIPESVKPIPEGSSVPALHEASVAFPERQNASGRLAGYGAAALIFIIGLAGFLFASEPVVRIWPASAAFYRTVGIDALFPGEGLVFDRLKITVAENLILEGQIINLTRRNRPVPLIEIRAQSAEGKETGRWFVRAPAETLESEQTISFRAEHADIPESAEINVRFATTAAPRIAAAGGGNNQVPDQGG